MTRLVTFEDLMRSPDVQAVALEQFGSDDWHSTFVVATATCLAALPQSDVASGVCTEGACVFYATTSLDEDAPAGPTLVYEPWAFTVDLGSCANYRFRKLDDPSWSYAATDSEEFEEALMNLLGGSLWLPVRGPHSIWG